MRIHYDSKSAAFKKPFGALAEDEICEISIHIPESCGVTACNLVIEADGGDEYLRVNMEKSGGYDGYGVYSCRFGIDKAGIYFYYFRINTQSGAFSLYKYGYDLTNIEDGEKWQLTCYNKAYGVPEWYSGRVMYQIFPDRFAKCGNPELAGKLEPYRIHESTSDIPDYLPDENGEVKNCDFFGGNLAGICEKLPYLASLGVSVIYLNPIFKAYSNHRYDTADYKAIDEMLGTESDFTALCDRAHSLGMRIILDGVFSHTGSDSIYFDKKHRFEHGAYYDECSPYRSWYDFKRYPDEYTSWWGIDTLPCVNELDGSYLDYIIDGEDSVVAHWLRLGADGFRLDVADELPDEFIARLRARLKALKPDSLLIGEVWEDASNKISYGVRRKYFTDGELDSVMNYPYKNAIIGLITKKQSAEDFRQSVMSIAENYPKAALLSLMNMLSTHDTPRILTLLGAKSVPEDKSARASYRMSADAYAEAEIRLKAAAAIQFALPGMPCIYYGDEIGTEGFEDPFCRTFFDWEKADNSSLARYFASLAKLRLSSDALMRGNLNVTMPCISAIKLTRTLGDESVSLYLCADGNLSLKISGNILFSLNADINDGTANLSECGFVFVRE